MNVEKIVSELNESKGLGDSTRFFYTSCTPTESVGIYSNGLQLYLWDSENNSFENEIELKEFLVSQLIISIEKLTACVGVVKLKS